jgi:Fe-S-cluster containining protein
MVDKCTQCGLCCSMFLVNLSKDEYYSGRYKTEHEKYGVINNFTKVIECGANILKKKNSGECFYLKNNRCSIHKSRPQVCRDFFCNSKLKKFQNMIKLIDKKRVILKKDNNKHFNTSSYQKNAGLY